MPVSQHFPTLLFQDRWNPPGLHKQLLSEIDDLMDLDRAGVAWSKRNYKNGFTSYASANEMHRVSPTFGKLESWIDGRVARYAKALDWDLGAGRLKMANCWVNVMGPNTHHGLHLHPLAVVSGTYYVSTPGGSPAIKFEDPRLSKMMHAPPRRERHGAANRQHVEIEAKAGSLVLFESWLRHEVPIHTGKAPRVSISFNYDWVE